MPAYSYEDCLERSYRVNWKITDVLGTMEFDLDRPWLPAALSGGGGISCLSGDERRKLTQVEMGAYAHLFGFVEAYIAPLIAELARDFEDGDRVGFEALTNFASEEVKHMHLFREVRRRVDGRLGFPLRLVAGESEVARAVRSRSRGAALLLTAAIEWFTQHHYVSAMKDAHDLDPLTKEIFRNHWLEEAQHARMDHLETLRAFHDMTAAEREEAVEDLIWLVGAVDGLLQQQVDLDLANLQDHLGRIFTEPERQDVRRGLLRAKRHCFIESGVTHPNFQALFLAVTTRNQQERVEAALHGLLAERGSGGDREGIAASRS